VTVRPGRRERSKALVNVGNVACLGAIRVGIALGECLWLETPDSPLGSGEVQGIKATPKARRRP